MRVKMHDSCVDHCDLGLKVCTQPKSCGFYLWWMTNPTKMAKLTKKKYNRVQSSMHYICVLVFYHYRYIQEVFSTLNGCRKYGHLMNTP
jgi:hypothetical protein